MKTKMDTFRLLLVLIPVIVVLCLLTGTLLAANLYPLGESFLLDLSDEYTADYVEDLNIYYFVLKSDPEAFLIADVMEFGELGFTGEIVAESIEDDSADFDGIKFFGKPQQTNGFRWRACERQFEDEWYESIFVYYETHLLRVSCIAGNYKNLYEFVDHVHPAGNSEDTGVMAQPENSDNEVNSLGPGFNLVNAGTYEVIFDEEANTYFLNDLKTDDIFLIAALDIDDYFNGYTQETLVRELNDEWEDLNENVLTNAKIQGAPQEIEYGISYIPMFTIINETNVESAYLLKDAYLLNIVCFTGDQQAILHLAENILPAGVDVPNLSGKSGQTNGDVSELYEKGKSAYDEKDYTSALPYLEQAAEMGSTESMILLGNIYSFGYGVKKSVETGRDYYLKAAELGNVEAQFLVGEMYSAGFGVEKSEEIASQYYIDAADQGYGDAQYKIGSRYYYGNRGVTQDYDLAFKYLSMAADQQMAGAQFLVGQMYDSGRGVDVSYEKAVEYYRLAAEQGYADAQASLGYMYYSGQGVSQSYEKAAEWYQKAADQGISRAQNNLGLLYFNGHGVDQSYETAAKYFKMAADQGNTGSIYMLGTMYYFAQGFDQSYATAAKYFQEAADQGDIDSIYMLGAMYYFGQGVEKSYQKAAEYYQKAAELGNVNSQYSAGWMYYSGLGVKQSYEKAAEYYQMAANQNHATSQNNLGWMYQNGFGVEQSYEKAAEYYQMAADQNHATSQDNLAWLYQHGLGVEQSDEKALFYYRQALSNLKAGDVLNIGSYEQDNNESNGDDVVEWLVIAVEENRALLVSKYGLDVKPYNEQSADVSWANSSIRSWLNGVFYEDTFSTFDKSRILQSVISFGSGEITDRIFLLSSEEIKKYETINYSTNPTDYAASKGVVIDENGYSVWWLRTDGLDRSYAACIDPNGKLDEKGRRKTDTAVMVAPAFWLDMKALEGVDSIRQFKIDDRTAVFLDAETAARFTEMGLSAYRDGDYEKAVDYLIPAAEADDVNAQYSLGAMYENGYGIEQSYVKAAEWYRKAADQGFAIPQNSLGYMYSNGFGVEQSYEKAMEWYQKAADQGYARSQYNLGIMYENGYGVEQSYEKAAEWYQKAADQGFESAQKNLKILQEKISD